MRGHGTFRAHSLPRVGKGRLNAGRRGGSRHPRPRSPWLSTALIFAPASCLRSEPLWRHHFSVANMKRIGPRKRCGTDMAGGEDSRHPWRSPCGPSAAPMFAPASCLRSEPLRGYHFSACDQKQKSPRKAGIFVWWRRGESNPRPKALRARRYMLSPAFDLVLKQHAGQSAPQNQPALFSRAPTGGSDQRSCDDDPTPTSTCTSGFGARP